MTKLSPVAQAVLIAFLGDAKDTGLEIDDMRENLASALRVVVTAIGAEEILNPDSNRTEGVKWCVQRIYAIASEIEAQQSDQLMTKELSPVARAVLQAVTLKRYDVPPEGLPGFALEMAPLIASALRGLVGGNAYEVTGGDEGWYSLVVDVDDIYAAADELDALTAEQLEAQQSDSLMTQELSPTAQAVWDAYQNAPMYFNDYEQQDRDAIALVLTAVADKLSYGHAVGSGMIDEDDIRALASEFLGESDQSQG